MKFRVARERGRGARSFSRRNYPSFTRAYNLREVEGVLLTRKRVVGKEWVPVEG